MAVTTPGSLAPARLTCGRPRQDAEDGCTASRSRTEHYLTTAEAGEASASAESGVGLVRELVDEVAEQLDDTLRCQRCRHEITAGRHAIEVSGAHAHTFRNPAGWSFRLGCFADAPGAAAAGAPTTEATWFPGYAWRMAHCGACGTHLGWWFVGGSDAFAGLVLTRLA